MGVRMWAPSMPLLLEPSTRLSRVAPQDDCLSTSTSVMPCFLKKPFSSATNSGAASVSAMKPSLAAFVSSAVPCAITGRGQSPPGMAAAPKAAAPGITVRREALVVARVMEAPGCKSNGNGVHRARRAVAYAGWTPLSGESVPAPPLAPSEVTCSIRASKIATVGSDRTRASAPRSGIAHGFRARQRTRSARRSGQHLGQGEHVRGDVQQPPVLVHRHLAQRLVGLVLAHV